MTLTVKKMTHILYKIFYCSFMTITAVHTTVSPTHNIIAEFQQAIDTEKEYTLREYVSILSCIYKNNTKKNAASKTVIIKVEEPEIVSDDDDDDKPKKRGRPAHKPKLDKDGNLKAKRKPSAYNMYVKQRIEQLKKENSSHVAQERMIIAAAEWKMLTQDEKDKYKNI